MQTFTFTRTKQAERKTLYLGNNTKVGKGESIKKFERKKTLKGGSGKMRRKRKNENWKGKVKMKTGKRK